MYPGFHAQERPEKPAVVMASSGEAVNYRQLNEHSNRLSHLWWEQGLRPGDHVAILMENHRRYYEVAWAALRSGLYLTTVNRYLTAAEAAYIVNDSESRCVVASTAMAAVVQEMSGSIPDCPGRLMVDGAVDGWQSYEEAIGEHPAEELPEQPRGALMLYSSGTTGRPKGIKRPLRGDSVSERNPESDLLIEGLFGIGDHSVYLSPAPLYHAAPLGFTLAVQARGGTVVVMERFDPELAMRWVEEYRITVSQWVPTMFIRMLKLPEEARTRYDLSSHQVAIHAAAPCPVEVKRRMIEWWGPIIHEYYAGTEGNGMFYIDSKSWLEKPGSVGKAANAVVHICDDEGDELPVGEEGTIYTEQDEEVELFEYYKDGGKTAGSRNPKFPRWTTLGDVGYVDEDGYLFLTDRKAFMIISGGVNIYPQEIENALVLHDKITDVAVIGVPNDEMGEEVKAVVQLADPFQASPELAEELIEYSRKHVAGYKVPRSIDFEEELPRLPTGKLYKRLLRDRYWGSHTK